MRFQTPRPRSAFAACGCALALSGAGPRLAAAQANTVARLHAAFDPYRLGRRTTLQFEFAFSAAPGTVPPPLIEIQLRYPRGINFFLNDLGIRRCTKPTLEASGPSGCPQDSAMGYGVVRTGVVLGDTPVEESSPITILRAPERDGHFALLFFAEGREPVVTNVIFSGVLLSAREPFGGKVQVGVPLVETLPGAPYVSVLHLHATIGPKHLTYYHEVDGVSLAFAPQGLLLPSTCPRDSFPFAAVFAFADGTRAQASTTVPCPPGQDVPRHSASAPGGNRTRGLRFESSAKPPHFGLVKPFLAPKHVPKRPQICAVRDIFRDTVWSAACRDRTGVTGEAVGVGVRRRRRAFLGFGDYFGALRGPGTCFWVTDAALARKRLGGTCRVLGVWLRMWHGRRRVLFLRSGRGGGRHRLDAGHYRAHRETGGRGLDGASRRMVSSLKARTQ
jgi:hypothetical protein